MGWHYTGLLHQIAGEVAGVEWGGNQYFSILNVLLERAVGALFIICDLQNNGILMSRSAKETHNVFMTKGLKPRTETKLIMVITQSTHREEVWTSTNLVLDGSQKTGLSGGCLATTIQNSENLHISVKRESEC